MIIIIIGRLITLDDSLVPLLPLVAIFRIFRNSPPGAEHSSSCLGHVMCRGLCGPGPSYVGYAAAAYV